MHDNDDDGKLRRQGYSNTSGFLKKTAELTRLFDCSVIRLENQKEAVCDQCNKSKVHGPRVKESPYSSHTIHSSGRLV